MCIVVVGSGKQALSERARVAPSPCTMHTGNELGGSTVSVWDRAHGVRVFFMSMHVLLTYLLTSSLRPSAEFRDAHTMVPNSLKPSTGIHVLEYITADGM